MVRTANRLREAPPSPLARRRSILGTLSEAVEPAEDPPRCGEAPTPGAPNSLWF